MTKTLLFRSVRIHQRRIPGVRGKKAGLFLALACLLPAGAARTPAQEVLSEYQVKAAYLFNFLKFVEWPDAASTDSPVPIVIGIVGEDPFRGALSQVITGNTVRGRDLVIHKYRADDNLRGARILFICASEKKRLPAILSSLHGSSVLTVSDLDGFLEAGGMIQFLNENDRVRFAINVDAASQARLKMSSKLLSLAKVVGGTDREIGK